MKTLCFSDQIDPYSSHTVHNKQLISCLRSRPANTSSLLSCTVTSYSVYEMSKTASETEVASSEKVLEPRMQLVHLNGAKNVQKMRFNWAQAAHVDTYIKCGRAYQNHIHKRRHMFVCFSKTSTLGKKHTHSAGSKETCRVIPIRIAP